jgi:hypothetical protein
MSRRPWWGGVRTVTRWGRRRIGIAIRRRIGVRTGRIGRSIIRIVEARSMWRRSMWRIRMMGVRRWRSMRRWTGRDMYWRRTLARWTRLALELNDGLANIPFFVHRRSNARHRTTAPFLLLGTLRPQQCICRRLSSLLKNLPPRLRTTSTTLRAIKGFSRRRAMRYVG